MFGRTIPRILGLAGMILAGAEARAVVVVSSSHIALHGHESGHNVGLYTAAGYSLPNASLTYPGSPSPASTSHLVINVDGTPISYDGAVGGTLMAVGSGLGASLSGSKNVGGLDVSVRYEIVLNPQSGVNPDTMMVRITLRNPGAVARQAAARLEWDTDINNVDGANISVNNGFSVVSSGEVYRKNSGNIPGNWWGYDIPPPPPTAANLVGRGSLFGNPVGPPATMPDAFEVVNWGSARAPDQWTLGAIGIPIGDSAVVLWWTGSGSETGLGHTLAPGAEISFTTYYGINGGTLLTTFTPTAQPTSTHTPTATPTPTFTVSPTFTLTPSPSISPTFTISPTFSVSPTFSSSPTASPTFTITPTFTPTPRPLTLTPKHPNPNPAVDEVYLPFVLSTPAEVDVRVFSVAGELVRAFEPVPRDKGAHEQRWDLRNSAGTRVASGVFLCRIRARSPTGEEDDAWVKCAVSR